MFCKLFQFLVLSELQIHIKFKVKIPACLLALDVTIPSATLTKRKFLPVWLGFVATVYGKREMIPIARHD